MQVAIHSAIGIRPGNISAMLYFCFNADDTCSDVCKKKTHFNY